jgi:lysozyme family protein
MTTRFNNFLPFIYKWENEYDNHHNVVTENVPGDPGGTTRYGIDKASHPGVDVANLTEPQAREIYWQEWQAARADDMPPGVGECFFNCCVNCGVGRARKIAALGPKTPGDFLDQQENFYRCLCDSKPALRKFLKGWLARTADLRKLLHA